MSPGHETRPGSHFSKVVRRGREYVGGATRRALAVCDAIDIHITGRFAQLGTRSWLIRSEHTYGGLVEELERRTVSERDPRHREHLRRLRGGDRMARANHGYAKVYAQELGPFIGRPVTLVEVLKRVLDGGVVDILIDDGPHAIDAIIATARALKPRLAERFVYIVEDNPLAAEALADVFPADEQVQDGLIVIKPRA